MKIKKELFKTVGTQVEGYYVGSMMDKGHQVYFIRMANSEDADITMIKCDQLKRYYMVRVPFYSRVTIRLDGKLQLTKSKNHKKVYSIWYDDEDVYNTPTFDPRDYRLTGRMKAPATRKARHALLSK